LTLHFFDATKFKCEGFAKFLSHQKIPSSFHARRHADQKKWADVTAVPQQEAYRPGPFRSEEGISLQFNKDRNTQMRNKTS